jgi:site-specific DNA recombinase
MRQAVAYVRVSTAGQALEGVSLEAQQAKIAAWCLANDYQLAATFTDAGISGSSMDGREGLAQALAATGKGQALVAYSISRIARSTRDMLDIAEQLERKGADLVSLSERIDTSSAAGRMVFRMLAVLAEFERDQVAERTRLALGHKKARRQVYARPPLGFAVGADGQLEPVAAEQAVVAEVIQRRAAGEGLERIAADLNQRGVKGKRGGRFSARTISLIAANTIHRPAA